MIATWGSLSRRSALDNVGFDDHRNWSTRLASDKTSNRSESREVKGDVSRRLGLPVHIFMACSYLPSLAFLCTETCSLYHGCFLISNIR